MDKDSVLLALKEDGYRIGNCQVVLYDRKRVDVFPAVICPSYATLQRIRPSQSKLGILPNLFCGMQDLSHDAITTYLANRPVLVLGIWTSAEEFLECGMAFPSTLPVTGNPTGPERSMFAGYGFFRLWGQPEAEILGMVGLAYFFNEFQVTAIHGLRYRENGLTARFVGQFGFKDNGFIPRYMMQDGKLVGAVCSTLLIEDFENYVGRKLLELYKGGKLGEVAISEAKAEAPG